MLLQRRTADAYVYPSMWSLFGGHLEENETAEQGIVRELYEETGIELDPSSLVWLGTQRLSHNSKSLHYFEAPLRVDIDQISLREGSGFALCKLEELQLLHLTPETSAALKRHFEQAGLGWIENIVP